MICFHGADLSLEKAASSGPTGRRKGKKPMQPAEPDKPANQPMQADHRASQEPASDKEPTHQSMRIDQPGPDGASDPSSGVAVRSTEPDIRMIDSEEESEIEWEQVPIPTLPFNDIENLEEIANELAAQFDDVDLDLNTSAATAAGQVPNQVRDAPDDYSQSKKRRPSSSLSPQPNAKAQRRGHLPTYHDHDENPPTQRIDFRSQVASSKRVTRTYGSGKGNRN